MHRKIIQSVSVVLGAAILIITPISVSANWTGTNKRSITNVVSGAAMDVIVINKEAGECRHNYFMTDFDKKKETNFTIIKTFTCKICGDEYTEELDLSEFCTCEKHEHTYTHTVVLPTCTERGYTTHTCTGCGDIYKDSYVPATGHKYTNGNCTECGEKDPSIPVVLNLNGEDLVNAMKNLFDDVTTITSFSTTNNIPENAIGVDLSEDKNKSIFLYKENSDMKLYFVGDTLKIRGSLSNMFFGYTGLTSIDLSRIDTSEVIDMCSMFEGCSNLLELDLSELDTQKVENMYGMFAGCLKMSTLNISKFNTSNVTNMGFMFQHCQSIRNIDISKFDTSRVTNMQNMFYGCMSLVTLNLSSFDTSNVTNMGYMFDSCHSLITLNLTSFNTLSVTNMKYMFRECKKLQSLDLSSFNTSNVESMILMFGYCTNLKSIYVSSDWKIAVQDSGMFSNCGCSNVIYR